MKSCSTITGYSCRNEVSPLDYTDELWAAFPTGYFPITGTTTVGGQQVLRGKDTQPLWYWPVDSSFSKPGHALFEGAKSTGILLPSLSDDATWSALLRYLAQRAGIRGVRGLTWFAKTGSVRDPKRNSIRKVVESWSLRTLTTGLSFPLPDVLEEDIALLKAIAMTNCACGRGLPRDCPMHGEAKARPWR